ncbi:MAG TPA: amidohydrolase family protein [Candidatus Dormibacteraeota bacterium]
MIVDAHVHVLPASMRRQRQRIADPWFAACHQGDRAIATVDDLLGVMDAAGIDHAVCLGWPFADQRLCAEVNDYLAKAQHAHPDRITGFGCVNPGASGAAAELRRIAGLGLRGVGELNCDAQSFALDDGRVAEAVAVSMELALPWTLHCSEPVGHAYAGKGTATPDLVAAFALRHPELKLVCAHLGGGLPFFAHMPEVAALCRRLWFDTAAVPFLYRPTAYRSVVDLVGADRLLFGSDYPLLGAERYLAGFTAAGLTDEEQRLILGGAVDRLLSRTS